MSLLNFFPLQPRLRPRHRPPALPQSTSGSLIPQRVHSPALLPPPTSNGEIVFRKPALPASVHSAGSSISSSHFVKPAIPRPGNIGVFCCRVSSIISHFSTIIEIDNT